MVATTRPQVAHFGIPAELFGPPIVRWAEDNILLPSLTPQPGPLKLTGPQQAILQAYDNPLVRQVTMMTGNQVGKSLILLAILGYHIAEAPRLALLVMPTIAVRNRFMREKFVPLVNSTPVINASVKRTERGQIPLDIIPYDRGDIHTAYSGSGTSLESVTASLVLADEVDGYRHLIDGQHPIDALHARISTFGNTGKLVAASTPTRQEGETMIGQEYLKGSQSEWHVPCPHCGLEHVLEWENVNKGKLYCPGCGAEITERQRVRAIDQGKFVEGVPNTDHKSFHLSQLYSHLIPLRQIVRMLDEGRMTMRGFTTRVLGRPYKATALEPLEVDDLAGLYQDKYEARLSAVTAAVDVQKDRVEYQVVRWTRMFPRIHVHRAIYRQKDAPASAVYSVLAKALAEHRPDMVFVDVGAFTDEVRQAARRQLRRLALRKRLHLVRGSTHPEYDGDQSGDLVLQRRNKMYPLDLWLGTNVGKEIVHEWLASGDISINPKGVPEDFSEQLLSEELRVYARANGQEGLRWTKKGGVRNEALDCLVYNLCARHHLGIAYDRKAREMAIRTIMEATTQNGAQRPQNGHSAP